MKRLGLAAVIVTLALALLTPPLAAGGQQKGKVYRIGVLAGDLVWSDIVWKRLPALSYRGGVRDIRFERKTAENEARLPELAAELVRLKVDVIVAAGTRAARAARDVTRTIPIVLVADADPVHTGLVASLSRPGGNVTGVTTRVPELSGKRLELLKEAVPELSRVLVLWNPADPDASAGWGVLQAAVGHLGLTVESLAVGTPDDLAAAFGRVGEGGGAALVVLADPFTASQIRRITAFAREHRLPAIYPYDYFVLPLFAYEGLMSYGPDTWAVAGRVVEHVDRILRGTNPAELPVERPTEFDLTINVKTANALGLTIPPSVLMRADKIIE